MTREEAIRHLKFLRDKLNRWTGLNDKDKETFTMAISALEGANGDTISRQAAIDALGERPMVWTESDYEIASRNQYDMDKLAIECVPAAQPETRYYGQFEIKDPILISERQWIPCSERLPEVGQDVLLSVGGVYTAEGCLRADGDWAQFRWDAIQRKDMVGAWMPLPEPYKEVEHGKNKN